MQYAACLGCLPSNDKISSSVLTSLQKVNISFSLSLLFCFFPVPVLFFSFGVATTPTGFHPTSPFFLLLSWYRHILRTKSVVFFSYQSSHFLSFSYITGVSFHVVQGLIISVKRWQLRLKIGTYFSFSCTICYIKLSLHEKCYILHRLRSYHWSEERSIKAWNWVCVSFWCSIIDI